MARLFSTNGLAALCIALFGCSGEDTEFALPAGDAEAGRRVFVDFRCNDCHTIADIEYSGLEVAVQRMGQPAMGKVLVKLGGQTPRYRSQAELVAAVINPSHKIATSYSGHHTATQSPMRNYNDAITVTNLIDLVAFLQAEYDVTPPRLIYKEYTPPPARGGPPRAPDHDG